MVTPRIFSLYRSLFTTTTDRTLTSFLLKRPFTTTSCSAASSSLFRLRTLAAVGLHRFSPDVVASSGAFRTFATRHSQTSLNDNSSNWSNRPPKETILLDGCDFEHWLIVTEPPPEGATRDEIIDSYIKTLAQVIGSEDEARMKIYSVSTRCYYAFGALVSEELSYKLKELPNVRWVLPDSYLDVKNKDYGGEPFINGQAVPYDPKYHEEWIRNNQKAMERNRRNDRPRNADRSRNFERRQRNQGSNMGGPGGSFGGPPNMGGAHNPPVGAPNAAGYGQNIPVNNVGFGQNMPPNNTGFEQNMPPNNPGFGQNMATNNTGFGQNTPPNNASFGQNMPPNNTSFGQNMPPNSSGFGQNMAMNNAGFGQNTPSNNSGFGQNMPPNSAAYGQNTPQNNPNPGFGQNMSQNNSGFVNAPNRGGMPPPNYGGHGNPGYQNTMPNYQGGGVPYQNTQIPNPQGNMGNQTGGGFQAKDVPERDMPPRQ